MIQEVLLWRESERVSNYIDNHVKLVAAEHREQILQLFGTMYSVFPHWVLTTCPMMHPDIKSVSSNCDTVFGFDRDYLIRISGMEAFMLHVHEDDQHDLYTCILRT